MSTTSSFGSIVDGFAKSSQLRAVEILRSGGLIGLPTETVYGLAADAENDSAVRRIFDVKARPLTHPLILHIADVEELDEWSREASAEARELGRIFWPGPLTMLVRRSARVSTVATGRRETVALRVPSHQVALQILKMHQGALAAPSANRFGKVSPTTAVHVLADLGLDVDLILDGGPCSIGVESTILDMTTRVPQLLRPGFITAAQIEQALGLTLGAPSGTSRAPGMLEVHYSPNCTVELADSPDYARTRAEQLRATSKKVAVLDYTDDLDAYAKHMYEFLRQADSQGCDVVVAVLPSEAGIGGAIRDRLIKASAK
ncbi:MAG: L-threonylcarbamoyladenylate synthase [Ilumatobacteraceae bacterium]